MAQNPRLIDMNGRRIGRWLVGEQAGNAPRGGALWQCECDCGTRAIVIGSDLRSGRSLSCGCEGSRGTIGRRSKTHGETGTRLYQAWQNMHRRCRDLSDPDYGGRGIRVAEQWSEYAAFATWANNAGYSADRSLERLDANKGYGPDNCIWTVAQYQSENRRSVSRAPSGRLWLHIARDNGISQSAYRTRLFDGWPHLQAATWPMRKKRRDGNMSRAVFVNLKGETLPITYAAKRLGRSPAAIYQRAKRKGISLQAAVDEMA